MGIEKPKRRKFRQETIIHSYIVRPIAQEIVLLLWHTNITPNQLTYFRVLLNIGYMYLFATGEPMNWLIAIGLFQVSEIIDHCDGMLARMKKMTSPLGQYLEFVTDELFSTEHGLLGFCISYGVYRYTGNPILIYLFVATMFLFYLSQNYKIKLNPQTISGEVTTKVDHDSEKMLEVVGVPFMKALRNLIVTIKTWKNQLMLIGLVVLIYLNSMSVLIITFCLYILLNVRRLYHEVTTGYNNFK